MLQLIHLLAIALFLASPIAEALHETDHRYNVRGYVLDANESPIAGSPVTIRLDDNVIGTGTTNTRGYYSIRLHLHDSDLGRTLGVHTTTGSASIKVTLTPGDTTTIRRHYANFIDGKLSENRFFFREFSTWLYGAAVGIVFIAVAIFFRKRFKRMSKNRRKLRMANQGSNPKKRKKHRKR